MRRLFGVLVLVVALSGCAQLGQVPTASVANPVTRDMLYDVENSAVVVFAGLNAYKRSCVAQAIPASCRSVIKRVQVYTRQVPGYLTQLRRFVRDNDQLNAVVIYNVVQSLLTNAKFESNQVQ